MTYVMGPPDPERLMRVFTSWEVATKENKWQRFNVWRWRNEEYDRLYRAAETEMDPVKRAALFIRMNDLVIQSGILIPIALRAKAAAISSRLRGVEHNAYDVDFWNLALLVPGGVAQTRLVHVTRRSPARREAGSRSYPGQTR